MRRYRSVSMAVFAIVFCALVGGFYGRSALAVEDQVPDQYKVFTAALTAIDATYVGTVESDRLVYGAITGMLQTLDPHSSFMDPRTYAQMRERQEGRYYGLGITIAVVDGEITVVSLFEGSPAYQKGLRRGDIIGKIEGEETKGWTSDDAVKKLRGPKGTPVRISLKRSGFDQLIDLSVVRVHARRADRLHPGVRVWREHRPGTGPGIEEPAAAGDEAARVRPAQQSRR